MKYTKAYTFTIIIAFSGALVISLSLYMRQLSLHSYTQNMPYFILLNDISTNINEAHLWFEEWVGGDYMIDYEKDVNLKLKTAKRIINDAINSDVAYTGYEVQLEDEKLRTYLRRIMVANDNFIQLTARRKDLAVVQLQEIKNNETNSKTVDTKPGSEQDNRYDATYQDINSLEVDMREYLVSNSLSDIRRLNITFIIIIVNITLLLIFVVIIQFRSVYRNQLNIARSKEKFDAEASRIRLLSDFIEELSDGNYKANLSINAENDHVAHSLVQLRDKLLTSAQLEIKRKMEVQQQNWVNEGIAKLSEIVHQSAGKIEQLSSVIIKNLVSYIGANQGGIFILNDDNPSSVYLELIAVFAYNRKKFLEKKVKFGQGLVGMCAVEKQTIYMTELPDDYIKITSGLGTSNPNTLLIVPLKQDDRIFGVIELAAFRSFDKFEIEFVEQIADTIASTLSTAKINARTKELLELSRLQAEEKASQEEELRQNMEEMQTIQEERERKKAEMQGLINAIDNTILRVEFDLDGTFIAANDNYLNLMELTHEELEYKNIRTLLSEKEKISFDRVWNNVCFGKQHKEVVRRENKSGKEFWLIVTYTPVEGMYGEYDKVLMLANDITIQKQMELKAQKIAEELRMKEEVMLAHQNNDDKLKAAEEVIKMSQNEKDQKERELRQKNRELIVQEEIIRMKLEFANEQISELKIQLAESMKDR